MGEALGRLRVATSEVSSKVLPITLVEPNAPQEIMDKLARLRLTGMARALQEQGQAQSAPLLSFEERLGRILDQELEERRVRRLARSLRNAGLRYQPSLEDVDWSAPRGFSRARLVELMRGDWVADKHNLLISGPVGAGKTFLACLVARAICADERSVRYARASQLAAELADCRQSENHLKNLASLVKLDLLVLDDWGLEPLENREGLALFELLEARGQRGSLLVVSPLPPEDWERAVLNPTLAAAMVDRLRERSLNLALEGPSRRGAATPA